MSHEFITPYERLSHDDGLQGESNSISNQKAMLEDYAEKNGFTGIRHFTDDGISGTTFDREGLRAMLAEVEKGNIGTIIVKDMSRLGRNYVQMGMLREQLRRADVRLIAVNEGVDTGSGFDDDFLPFRDVINEYYAKDISKKIKSTFKAKGESGKRVPMYVCGNYAKQPVGTLCRSAHRIKADHVMEVVAKTIKEVIQYASLDIERFAEEIQSHIEGRQTVDFTEQKKRMAICEKRIGELEILIAKIYEDNALGKLSDKRYTMLYNQYEGEQEQLQGELDSYSLSKGQRLSRLKELSKMYALYEPYHTTYKESQALKGIAKMKYDREHKESLAKYPEMRERLQNLLEHGEKITPKHWKAEIQSLQAEYDSIGKEQTKTATELAYAEVISYNRKNLERELVNESRQHNRQLGRTKRREETI